MGKVFAGTSGWAYAQWRPGFYPAKLASGKFLGYYATRLNSVELNYTFHRYVTKKLLAGWIEATPAGFKFAVKANQKITHVLRLYDAAEATAGFLRTLEPLRQAEKLGPVLFQLPPFLKCDRARLEGFLAALPQDIRAAIEFRHVSWFSQDVFDLMRKANVALCQAESEKLETPSVATADFRYLRLRKGTYSPAVRKALAKTVADAASAGDVFVYFKHEDTPEGALYAEDLLRDARVS